jgi:hypothetical protein
MTWVPSSCTLPTAEQPLRVAAFDELFATAVTERVESGRLSVRLEASPEVAAAAARLAVEETGCCSFFTFALTAAGGRLTLDITVGPAHTDVLDALVERVRVS